MISVESPPEYDPPIRRDGVPLASALLVACEGAGYSITAPGDQAGGTDQVNVSGALRRFEERGKKDK